VPESIVYNRGPATVGDFLKQRRRIHAGHLRIYRKQGYAVATLNVPRILEALLRNWDWRHVHWILAIIALEAYGRLLGWMDHQFGQAGQHAVWDIARSTKGAIQ
jgi:cellulose synthase/poly-beta-1,6-N-acetylglucosamine synthase-like glycosyltransferase